MKRMLSTLTIMAAIAGCSTTVEMPEIPVTHPAHVDASSAPMPGPPSVFAVDADVVAKPGLPVPDHQAQEEHMHGQMGPDDSVHTHVHDSYASTSRTHPNPQDAPMPGEPGVVFACQIHPDVKSEMDGQCPHCGLPLLPKVPPKPMSMWTDDLLEPHMDPLNVGNVPPTVIDEPRKVEPDERPSMMKQQGSMQHQGETQSESQSQQHMQHNEMQQQGVQSDNMQHQKMQHERMPSSSAGKATVTYACPHHPEITASFAGATCPKCGMTLTAVEGAAE